MTAQCGNADTKNRDAEMCAARIYCKESRAVRQLDIESDRIFERTLQIICLA
jgi:hypothetical protein